MFSISLVAAQWNWIKKLQHCYVVQFALQGYCKFPAREMTPLFPDNERDKDSNNIFEIVTLLHQRI